MNHPGGLALLPDALVSYKLGFDGPAYRSCVFVRLKAILKEDKPLLAELGFV